MHLTSASLRTQLITLVCLVTLIPFAAGQWLSYRQTAAVIRENMDEQTRLNLQQMEKTLDATLASYEDLLYQIYTNDTVVELVNKLAAGEDVALSRNQLRREIQEKVFAKPYLGAITVLFEDGSYSTYDKRWLPRPAAPGWTAGTAQPCTARWPPPTPRIIFLRPMP